MTSRLLSDCRCSGFAASRFAFKQLFICSSIRAPCRLHRVHPADFSPCWPTAGTVFGERRLDLMLLSRQRARNSPRCSMSMRSKRSTSVLSDHLRHGLMCPVLTASVGPIQILAFGYVESWQHRANFHVRLGLLIAKMLCIFDSHLEWTPRNP